MQALRKLREAAELKCYASHLEQEGLQELKLAMVGNPASWLVDLMTARVHKTSKSAPLSSGASFPHLEGQQAPSPSGPALKKAPHTPITTILLAPKREATMQEVPLPLAPEAIAGPLGTSMLPMVLQGRLPISCHIPPLALPVRSFK